MFSQYIIAFCWGVAVLLAWVGYGWLVNIILIPQKKIDFGLKASFGITVSIVAGGILNLAKFISIFSIAVFVSIGFLLFVIFLVKKFKSLSVWVKIIRDVFAGNKLVVAGIFCILALLLTRYVFAVSFFNFNALDDYHAYLSFPAKMLQTGSLGNDPFSERRIESSLGGNYFLDALILSFSSFKNLHLVDNGLGYLVFVFLIIGFCRKLKIVNYSAVAVLFLALIISSPVINLTACYIASALFFTFFYLIYFIEEFKTNSIICDALVIALPLSALVALKSTFIPVVGVLLLGYYYIHSDKFKNVKNILKELVCVVMVMFVFLLPWMLAMYQSSGTLLYPIFGKGYYGTVYGAFKHNIEFNFYSLFRLVSEFVQAAIFIIPLLGCMGLSFFCADTKDRKIFQLILVSSLLGVLSVIFLIGGYALYYYSFPYILPTLFFVGMLFLGGYLHINKLITVDNRTIGLLLIVFLAGSFLQKDLSLLDEVKNNINIDSGKIKIGLLNSDLVSGEDMKQYVDLQKAIPSGNTIIARLDKNYLFDFKRNPIYINDIPGGASLPPGLPLKQGSEVLAEYFLAKNIRYVTYSYGNEAGFPRQSTESMLRPHVNPLLHAQTENSLTFQDYLMELKKTRKSIYDDGKNFVLDLSIRNNI